jgi:hypothetical protein
MSYAVFIMPGFVLGARLHGGKNMHQPGRLFAALFDDLGNQVLFADKALEQNNSVI